MLHGVILLTKLIIIFILHALHVLHGVILITKLIIIFILHALHVLHGVILMDSQVSDFLKGNTYLRKEPYILQDYDTRFRYIAWSRYKLFC